MVPGGVIDDVVRQIGYCLAKAREEAGPRDCPKGEYGEHVSDVVDDSDCAYGMVRMHVVPPIGGVHVIFADKDLCGRVKFADAMDLV